MNLFSLGMPTWFWEAINSLWLMICQGIYIFINYLYRVFDKVARVNLFSEEVFKTITGRLYIVIGITMLFIFAYNLILMIINPNDKKGTGAMTKVVKETIISLVVVILLPTIFNYMYTFQGHILDTNIIGQIILGNVGSTAGDFNCAPGDYECNCDFSSLNILDNYSIDKGWGSQTGSNTEELSYMCKYYKSDYYTDSERGAFSIGPTIFSTFYRPTNFTFQDCSNYLIDKKSDLIKTPDDEEICVNFFYDVLMSKYKGNIEPFVKDDFLNAKIANENDNSMRFDWLFAIIAGALAIWMFICYTLEIGVRVAKLGLLQIVSPIAVLMRIIPGQKEKIFDKWFNQLKHTYLDVFIRLVIIFFSLFAISLVPDVINTMWESLWSGGDDSFVATLATVVVILGILKFGQEAPALIKEFFGSSGNFALRSPKKQIAENKLAMGGINAFRGGMYGATTGKGWGRLGGFFSGAARGAVGGYDKAVKGLDTIRTERANGSTFGGRLLDRTRTAIGMETIGERDERNLEKKFNTKERTEQNERVQKHIDTIKSKTEAEITKDDSKVMFDFTTSDGTRYEGLTYGSIRKSIDAMQKQAEDAQSDEERIAIQKKIQDHTIELEKQKKSKVTSIVNQVFTDRSEFVTNDRGEYLDTNGNVVDRARAAKTESGKIIGGATIESILSAQREINTEIVSTGSVGVQYDEDGRRLDSTAWKSEISDAAQIFGGKDRNNIEINSTLRDSLTSQRTNISERASSVRGSKKYHSRQANSRVVRGQGKSEKK